MKGIKYNEKTVDKHRGLEDTLQYVEATGIAVISKRSKATAGAVNTGLARTNGTQAQVAARSRKLGL